MKKTKILHFTQLNVYNVDFTKITKLFENHRWIIFKYFYCWMSVKSTEFRHNAPICRSALLLYTDYDDVPTMNVVHFLPEYRKNAVNALLLFDRT